MLEEGLALRSLTSPTLCPVADWAPRLLDLNTAYAAMVLPYHVVFSIVVPIALTDRLFPRLRHEPYLRTPGLVLTSVVLLLGLLLLRAFAFRMDPTHREPAAWAIGEGIVVAGLVAWAWSRRPAPPRPGRLRRPRALVVVGALAPLVYFGLLMPPRRGLHSAALPDGWSWLAPLAAVGLLVLAGVVASRWARIPGWSGEHTAGLLAGALPAHTVLGLVLLPMGGPDRVGLGLLLLAEVALGVWLVRRGVPGRGWTRAVTVLAAAAAALLVWAVATTAGVRVDVRTPDPQTVGAVSVVVTALVAGLAGWGVRALLDRTTRNPRRVWLVVALTVLLVSLAGPLTAAAGSAAAVLVALHLAVGGILVAGLGRR